MEKALTFHRRMWPDNFNALKKESVSHDALRFGSYLAENRICCHYTDNLLML